MKIYRLSLLGIMALFLFSCHNDDVDVNPFTFLDAQRGMVMSYDLRTTRSLRPVNPDYEAQLTQSERSLMVPEVNDMKVHFELDTAGNYFYRIDIKPSPVTYPTDMIGRNYVTTMEKVGRIEFRNSGAQFFDKNGAVMNDFYPNPDDVLFYKEMATQLSERVILPQDQFELFMQAWEEAGYEVKNNGGNTYSIQFDLSGGRTTYVYVDKVKQNIIGTANYEADGSLVNRTYSITTVDPINPESIVSIFTTPFKAPLSDTDMEIMVTNKATNIVKTLKL